MKSLEIMEKRVKTLENQLEMLKKTAMEQEDRGIEVSEDIIGAIGETLCEIERTKALMCNMEKEPSRNEIPRKSRNRLHIPFDGEERPRKLTKEQENAKNMLEELRSKEDSFLMENRFLVEIPELGIKPYHVVSFQRLSDGLLSITVRNAMVKDEDSGIEYPLEWHIEMFRSVGWDIPIIRAKYLDSSNKFVYAKVYRDCSFVTDGHGRTLISYPSLNSNSDNIQTITFELHYKRSGYDLGSKEANEAADPFYEERAKSGEYEEETY